MKPLWKAACVATMMLATWNTVRAELSETMLPQPQISLTKGSSGTWNADWQGVTGRTYLMQWSEDMVNWNYFSYTESGAGSKAYGFRSSSDNFFIRLECSDETPDLANSSVWQPPLLMVGGEWTVLAKQKNGDPASGVELAFYRWPANTAKPQTTPLSKARTGSNGTCDFNPYPLNPGDRVEVRMTGSPNQRVYLPWLAGRETPDTNITPGGDGVARTGFVLGQGTGKVPDYEHPPDGTETPGKGPNLPVYRLLDFMTSRWVDSHEEEIYPTGFHQVYLKKSWFTTPPQQTIEVFSDPNASNHACPVYWDQTNFMGWGIPDAPLYFGYERTLSVALADPDLTIKAKRNVFIGNDFLDSGGVYFGSVVPDAVYTPETLELADGVEIDLGSDELPMVEGEFQGDAEILNRFLILGPVPMHVPKEVLGGKPFYFNHLIGNNIEGENEIKGVKFCAELPMGTSALSGFIASDGERMRKKPKVIWTVSHNGPEGLGMKLETDNTGISSTGSGNSSQIELEANEGDRPRVKITFKNLEEQSDIHADFDLTVKAALSIPNPLPGVDADGDGYPDGVDADGDGQPDWEYTRTNLGEFTTRFRFVPQEKQASEQNGADSDAPESSGFNGGQRFSVIETERKIGISGEPADESSSFVDALTGRFHHSETDFALAVPGSDLSLAVTRQVRDSVWTHAYGLSPSEDPMLVFGPGWDSNLCAALTRTVQLRPDGTEWKADDFNQRLLKSRITVRDYLGQSIPFMEYQNSSGATLLIPDPTLSPERSNAGISLIQTEGGFTLSQPSLGITHTYQKSSVDFRIANNRDVPSKTDASSPEGVTQSTGYTRYEYYRLVSVTDRFGVSLDYTYGTNPANLIPDSISVHDRPALQLRFKQSAGRIDAFWDPAGVEHGFTYDSRNLAAPGQNPATHTVLVSRSAGSRTLSAYGYQYVVEPDPRPAAMLYKTTAGQPYTIDTYHIAPSSIANGIGDTITVNQRVSTTRRAWSKAASAYFNTAGDPLVVDSIHLPNQKVVAFDLQHVLKNAAPGHSAELSVKTLVTSMYGDHRTYEFGTSSEFRWVLPEYDRDFLPSAGALMFPTLTRSCSEMSNSAITYIYRPEAGAALGESRDAANRVTSATYDELFSQPNALYQAPQVSPGVAMNSRYELPSTTTDRFNRTTTYDYVNHPGNPDHMLVASITDFRNRVTTPVRGLHARTESIKLEKGSTLLSRTDYGYDTTLTGAVNKITRKAISGSDDPAWVTDLVKDIHLDANGFPQQVGNDAASLHTTYARSPAGRVLEVTLPNGGKRSNLYNDSGLLEASFLEDGSGVSYGQDLAGRTVFVRDAMGIASGIELDPLGRVTKAVRDMNGNLGFNAAGGLTGVDAGSDLIATSQFLDDSHEVRMTDPRGYVSIRRFNAFGQTVKSITPGNDRAPGTLPNEANDRVTDIAYDLLKSPDSPVSVSDPSGYETIYKFDTLARPKTILREYGRDASNNDLYSGTVFGYDTVTGLPDTVTAIRTPLDVDGNPVGSTSLEQLSTRIERDDLDRAITSIHAYGTDKELRSKDSYTSTGIRWRMEIRDAIASGSTQEHWNSWELTCDGLGRPTRRSLPETVDALTSQTARPFTDYLYDANGDLSQTGDSYGNLTTFGYDIRGLLSWRKEPAVEDAKSGQTLEPVHTRAYDANGLLIHTVDPLGYAWDYSRDAAGRVKTTTGPIVSPAAPSSRRRPVWERDYDPAGNLLQVTDPEGHTRSLSYYPDSQVKNVTTPVTFTDESGTPSLVDVVEHYTRDSLGRVIQVEDGNHQITSFTHDGLGRQLTSTRDPGDTRAKTETTTYDALLPVAIEDAAGQVKEFGYDDQFRLNHIDVTGKPAESLDFAHDVSGNVTGITPVIAPSDLSMGNPSISRSYDALGLLAGETSNGVTTTYGYDLNGLLSKVTNTANSRVLSIQHDAAGRNSRVMDSGFGAPLETLFGHDLAGNLVREEMSNGLVQESDYDPIQRVTSRRVRNTGGTVCRTDYQYDLLSNVTRIEESGSGFNIPDRLVENTYNELGQLLTETQTRTGGSLGTSIHKSIETHRYDAAENRISTGIQNLVNDVPTGSLSRVFDYGDATDGFSSNQLHQLTETPGGGSAIVTSYSYDNNGNRTGRTIGATTDVYTWDAFNRLTGYQLNTAGSGQNGEWQYSYDPQSRRIARRATGQTARQFAFSGSSPVHEWEGALNNGSLVDHIGGGVGGRLYSQDASGMSAWAFSNVRGDLIAEFSTAGSMTWQGVWSADGILKDQSGTRSGNYGPNGKWQEPGGLTNEGFRYLDRLTGTFLSRDPAGFIDGLNDYNYVHRNPWSAWDPDGLATYIEVPTGTKDVGYAGQSTPVMGTSTDRNGGLPPDSNSNSASDRARVGVGPTVTVDPVTLATNAQSADEPEVDPSEQVSPISPSPHDLMLSMIGKSPAQLNRMAEDPNLSPEDKKRIQEQSQSASDAQSDYEIASTTTEGLSYMAGEAPAVKGAVAAVVIVIRGVVRAGTTVKIGAKAEGVIAELASAADDVVDSGAAAAKGIDTGMPHMPGYLPDSAPVLRGGQNLPENFLNGSGVSVGEGGLLDGVSVNSSGYGQSLAEIANGIPHSSVGSTTVGEIRALGGDVIPRPTPRNPLHSILSGVDADTASKLMKPLIKNPAKTP